MKTILTCLAIVLATLTPALCVERPDCEIEAHCFSMSAKDAAEFTLTFNPAGQAGFSIEQLDQWVQQKKAVSLGRLSTKGQSGLHLQAAGKEFSLDTETVVAPGASTVDILSKLTFPDQEVMSNVTCNNNQFAFAGNSTPKNLSPDSRIYFVYLVSRIGK